MCFQVNEVYDHAMQRSCDAGPKGPGGDKTKMEPCVPKDGDEWGYLNDDDTLCWRPLRATEKSCPEELI